MTKHIRLLSALSLSLVLSAPLLSHAAGGDEDVKKQKLINRSYDVTADDKLKIDNQFGNVTVSTWDKQQITVDIEISASAATDEKAQNIMDQIEVHEDKDDHEIYFKTDVNDIHNGNGERHKGEEGKRSFYIDYVIHMPAANPLYIENSFGKTAVPDMSGLVNLTSKFGSLTAGKLEQVDAIDVEFGTVAIAEITNGKISLKFDKESKIGMINGNVKITSEFSQHVQFIVGDDIEDLSVFESYSGIRLVIDKSLSADIEVHTSFGNFHNESAVSINEHKEDEGDYGPHFDKDYSGKAGDGKAKIRIKSSFGSVRLSYTGGGNDDEDDDKDKDKEKEKNKSRSSSISVS
jgi:hypothetical protein